MRERLDIKLFSQPFQKDLNADTQLESAKYIAQIYNKLENCISVLSDLKVRKSYIYYSALADAIGLKKRETEINSIWEDELLSKVHPDDLLKKYQLEFQFFNTLNELNINERVNYELITRLRIKDATGKYLLVKHRLLYILASEDGNVWLALCLYSIVPNHPEISIPNAAIINTLTGKIIEHDQQRFTHIISAREREILQLIKLGLRSKEIADELTLSINTINRHRQNIFNKLNATNAFEACRIAESMGFA